MESLLYVPGLQKAAKLAEYIGHDCVAQEYRERAIKVQKAVRAFCMGEVTAGGRKVDLIQDDPGVPEYSTHCQVFAVLTQTVDMVDGKEMLRETVGNEKYPQCSLAMGYYLLRALEMTDWYEKSDDIWNTWREMLDNHLTTCVENDTDARSDCHAWGAVALYELPAVILGVRPAKPGFAEIEITPRMGYLTEASGKVITPKGEVFVHWKKAEDGSCMLEYVLPEGLKLSQGEKAGQ